MPAIKVPEPISIKIYRTYPKTVSAKLKNANDTSLVCAKRLPSKFRSHFASKFTGLAPIPFLNNQERKKYFVTLC